MLAILSVDNIKTQMSFFLKLRERERERGYVIAMLRKGVGRNSLNVYLAFDGFLLRIFSLSRASGVFFFLHSSA